MSKSINSHHKIGHGPTAEGQRDQPGYLATQLEAGLEEAGATLVGYADVSPFLPYLPARLRHLKTGIAIGRTFSPLYARKPGRARASKQYVREYSTIRESMELLVLRGLQLLEPWGYEARGFGYKNFFSTGLETMLPSEYLTAAFQHKSAATRAGLGWIGKMGVLVNPDYGPHLWLASIITSAPLPLADPVIRSGCGSCRKCLVACPAGAIEGALWKPGLPRAALLDVKKCQAHRRKRSGPDLVPMCGLCLAACPFGRPKQA